MQRTLLLITLLLFTVTACQKRTCPQTDTYNGLYNAITCDYKSQTLNLEQSLSDHELNNIASQKKKHNLENKIYLQENELTEQKEQVKNKKLLLKNVKKEVDNINTNKQTKEILETLNLQIKNMHNALKEEKY